MVPGAPPGPQHLTPPGPQPSGTHRARARARGRPNGLLHVEVSAVPWSRPAGPAAHTVPGIAGRGRSSLAGRTRPPTLAAPRRSRWGCVHPAQSRSGLPPSAVWTRWSRRWTRPDDAAVHRMRCAPRPTPCTVSPCGRRHCRSVCPTWPTRRPTPAGREAPVSRPVAGPRAARAAAGPRHSMKRKDRPPGLQWQAVASAANGLSSEAVSCALPTARWQRCQSAADRHRHGCAADERVCRISAWVRHLRPVR